MTSRSTPWLLVLTVLAACGGKTDGATDSGTTDSGGTDSGNTDAGPGPSCPASAPNAGDSCTKSDVQCEYGGDPRWTCNALATCSKGAWVYAFGGDPSCPTPPTNPQACPATFEQAQNAGFCKETGTACDYATSTATRFCSCAWFGGPPSPDGGTSSTWTCSLGTSTGCPAVRPHVGSPCTSDLFCSYDVCGIPSGLSVQCDTETGTWVTSPGDVCAGSN